MNLNKNIILSSIIFFLILTGFLFFNSAYFSNVEQKIVNEFKPTERFDPLSSGWKEVDGVVPWGGRDSHTIYEFNEKVFLFGGLDGTKGIVGPKTVIYEQADYFNDIWSSSVGVSWVEEKKESNLPKLRSASVISWQGALYLYGGWGPQVGYNVGIWKSQNGIDWEKIVKVPDFGGREGQKVIAFKDKLYLIGGVSYELRKTFNDVWESVDGVSWKKVSAGPWHERWDHDVVSFNDKLWLTSGMNFNDEGYDDIWSSEDAVYWSLVSSSTLWGKRQGHGLVVYKDYVWLIGGLDAVNDVGIGDTFISRNGIDWQELPVKGEWTGREDHTAYVFKGKLYFSGGMGSDWTWQKDLWVLDEMPCGTEFKINKTEITSKSWGLYCLPKTNVPFYLDGSDTTKEIKPIASITKLMTALISAESLTGEVRIGDEVIGPGSKQRYLSGDVFDLENAVTSLLVESDNDIARALAEKKGEAYFINLMNLKTTELGLKMTSFKNSSGLDLSPSAVSNTSSVYDLARFMSYLFLQKPSILKMGLHTEIGIKNQRGELHHQAISTNELLKDFEVGKYILGYKTGETPLAKKNLVTVFENDKKEKFVLVVLDSEDHFVDTKSIMKGALR